MQVGQYNPVLIQYCTVSQNKPTTHVTEKYELDFIKGLEQDTTLAIQAYKVPDALGVEEDSKITFGQLTCIYHPQHDLKLRHTQLYVHEPDFIYRKPAPKDKREISEYEQCRSCRPKYHHDHVTLEASQRYYSEYIYTRSENLNTPITKHGEPYKLTDDAQECEQRVLVMYSASKSLYPGESWKDITSDALLGVNWEENIVKIKTEQPGIYCSVLVEDSTTSNQVLKLLNKLSIETKGTHAIVTTVTAPGNSNTLLMDCISLDDCKIAQTVYQDNFQMTPIPITEVITATLCLQIDDEIVSTDQTFKFYKPPLHGSAVNKQSLDMGFRKDYNQSRDYNECEKYIALSDEYDEITVFPVLRMKSDHSKEKEPIIKYKYEKGNKKKSDKRPKSASFSSVSHLLKKHIQTAGSGLNEDSNSQPERHPYNYNGYVDFSIFNRSPHRVSYLSTT